MKERVILTNFGKTLVLAFLFVSCDTSPDNTKTLVVEEMPQYISLSASSEQTLINGDAIFTTTQTAGQTFLNTEGLYILAAILPNTVFTQVVDGVLNHTLSPKNVPDWGEAFCVAKISNGAARRRLLNLKGDLATYWEGGTAPAYFTALLYITPDARFIVKCDFSVGKYSGAVSEFYYKYGGGDFTTLYEVDANVPVPLLSDDFLTEILGKF